MKRGKAAGMVLAVALAAGTMFSGCGNENGGNQGGESGSGSSESAKSEAPSGSEKEDASQGEKPEISISILERGNCPADEGTMEDNRWTRYINENSPVTVKWVPVPRTESVAKINALFASGEAPDLVWEFGKGFMDGLYTQDVIQPVDEYVEQYSTSYKQYLEAHPELKPYLIAEDRKMYGMTSARTPLGVANHGMWIRKDWLDALELSVPQTMEELNAVALAFTKEDPDGNGQNDTFGIGFNYNWITIMKSMYGQPSEGMMVEDGVVGDWSGSRGYGDCFAQIKSWYENGVIDPEYVTDTNYEKQRQYLVTGKTGIWLGSYNHEAEWRELKTNVPEAEWIPLEPVETSYGRFGLYQEPPAQAMICMNKDCENPEAVMKFLDWLIDGGWYALSYGEEGVHYNLVDGIAQKTDPDKVKAEVAYASEYAIVRDEVIDDVEKYITVTSAQDELSQEYASIRANALETAMKNEFRRDVPYTPSTELSAKYNADFNAIITSIEAKMITDSGYSVEDGLAEIKTEQEALGLADVLAERQAWYDANKDSF
ncbi:MAG: extracellular solute-binding protein [Lachnospiraceae bacterium]|nr:extracellular solute-binding protein [uncultured Acetatifactor sp.]MCI9218135.1 extracellular solute-binding protein [Lachnospiraceae bacterium]